MKIIGISCGRKNGNSELLLKTALQSAKETCGAEVEYLRLQDHKINPCTGCELCSNSDNWPNGKFPESGYMCRWKKDSDHLAYIFNKIQESDALILSTPVYNLTVPGILLVLLNRIHALGMAKHMEGAAQQKTICATISVGGSDMTNLIRPMLNFTAVELCGSQMNLVDQMHVQFCAPLNYVALCKESLQRAAKLGERVAALKEEAETGNIRYFGKEDNPELCPVCHGDIIQLSGKRFRCPVCNILGDVSIVDGEITMKWDGGVDSCRLSENEFEEDVHIKQRAPYQMVKEHKEEVRAAIKKIADYLPALEVPSLPESQN